jgi:hypothetical protein
MGNEASRVADTPVSADEANMEQEIRDRDRDREISR